MELESHEKQNLNDGYGAIFHRVYTVVIDTDFESVQKAMRDLQSDPNGFSPQLLARFEKVHGNDEKLRENDEFQIHITGPWNGPVRVEEVNENHFRLATLEGHMEAGQIQFRLKKISDHETEFEIESLARSKDALVDFVYDKLPLAKFAQTEMWCSLCHKFAEHALEIGGKKGPLRDVQVVTERKDEKTGQWEKIE